MDALLKEYFTEEPEAYASVFSLLQNSERIMAEAMERKKEKLEKIERYRREHEKRTFK